MRNCINCQSEISGCMGFCLARDIITAIKEDDFTHVRELCGKCVLLFELKEIKLDIFPDSFQDMCYKELIESEAIKKL